MNKLMMAVACCALCVARAEVAADYVEGEKSAVLVTPQVMAAAEFMGSDLAPMMHALKLQMTKYDLDMKTRSGRMAWHGKLVGEEVYTNELVKVEVYSNEVDGAVWRYKSHFKPKPMVKQLSPARRKTTYTTNGIPARLAAARARRADEIDGGPVTTNITTTANAPK